MKPYDWNDERNEWLRHERGGTFEDIVFHLAQGGLLDTIEHPNPQAGCLSLSDSSLSDCFAELAGKQIIVTMDHPSCPSITISCNLRVNRRSDSRRTAVGMNSEKNDRITG